MTSEPRKIPTNMPRLESTDQNSRINSPDESGIGDFINPDFEFDQFETELAATKGISFHLALNLPVTWQSSTLKYPRFFPESPSRIADFWNQIPTKWIDSRSYRHFRGVDESIAYRGVVVKHFWSAFAIVRNVCSHNAMNLCKFFIRLPTKVAFTQEALLSFRFICGFQWILRLSESIGRCEANVCNFGRVVLVSPPWHW